MAINLGSAVGYLLLDSSGFSRGFQSAMQDMKNFNASTNGISDKVTAVGNAMQSMGGTLTTSVTLPLVGLGKQILSTAMEFEQGMSAVEALTGASAREMEQLKQKAIEMGAATVYSAKDSADAMTYMGQAGWKTQDILDGLEGVMYAAAASGEDMASVSAIVTQNISAFGMEAAEAARMADVLAVAAAESQVNIADLGESLKYAGPIAGTLGYSIEDVNIALGIMGNQGIKGSQAGTTLRRALIELNQEAGATGVSMRDLGVDNDNVIMSMQNADGTMKPFMQTMQELRLSFSGLTEAQQLQAAESLFGANAMSGMLAIINASEEDFNNMTQAVYDSTGAAQAMADVMLDNAAGSVEGLMGSLETLAIQLGDILIPIFRNIVDRVDEWVTKFTELDTSTQEMILKIAGIAAATGPVLLVLGKLTTLLGTIPKIVGGVGKAFSVLLGNPVLLIIAAIVAAFVYLMATNEEFREKIINVGKKIQEGFLPVIETMKEVFQNLGTTLREMLDRLEPALAMIAESIGDILISLAPLFEVLIVAIGEIATAALPIVESVIETIAKLMPIVAEIVDILVQALIPIIQKLAEVISKVLVALQPVIDVILELVVIIAQILVPIIEEVADVVSIMVGTTLEVLSKLIDFVVAVFTGDWEGAWNAVQEIFETVWGFIQELFDKILGWFGTSTEEIIGFFKTMKEDIDKWIARALVSILGWAGDMVASAKKMGEDFINKIKEFFSQTPEEIGFQIGEALVKVVGWAGDMVQEAREMGRKFLAAIVEYFPQIPTKVHEYINKALVKVGVWAIQMRDKAIEAGTNFVKGVIDFIIKLPARVVEIFNRVLARIGIFDLDAAEKASSAAKNIFNAIIDGIKNLPENVRGIGKDIVTGLWNGIMNAGPWIREKVGGFARGVLNGMKSALGIKSPSTEAAILGDFFAQGFAMGFEDAADITVQDMGNSFQSALDAKFKPKINTDFGIMSASYSMVRYVYNSTDSLLGLMSTAEGSLMKLSGSLNTLTDDLTSGQDTFVQTLYGSTLNISGRAQEVAKDSTQSIVGMFDKFGHEIRRVSGSIVETYDGTYSRFRNINEVMSEINSSSASMITDMSSSVLAFANDTNNIVEEVYSGVYDMSSSLFKVVDEFSHGTFSIVDETTSGIRSLLDETQGAFSKMSNMVDGFGSDIATTFTTASRQMYDFTGMLDTPSLASSTPNTGTPGGMSIANVTSVEAYAEYWRRTGQGGTGNTYVFNSPENIDAVEAVRQMRLANQEMAMR